LISSSENQIDKKNVAEKDKVSYDIFISENQQLDNDSSQNIKLTKIDIIFIILRKTTGQRYYVHLRQTGWKGQWLISSSQNIKLKGDKVWCLQRISCKYDLRKVYHNLHKITLQRSQLSYFCSLSYISTICPTCPTFFGFLSYILEICPTFKKISFFSFQNQGKIAETYAYSKNVTFYCFLCQSCVDKYRYFVKQIATTLQVLRKTTFFKFLIFF